jgi:hypothetical protein
MIADCSMCRPPKGLSGGLYILSFIKMTSTMLAFLIWMQQAVMPKALIQGPT